MYGTECSTRGLLPPSGRELQDAGHRRNGRERRKPHDAGGRTGRGRLQGFEPRAFDVSQRALIAERHVDAGRPAAQRRMHVSRTQFALPLDELPIGVDSRKPGVELVREARHPRAGWCEAFASFKSIRFALRNASRRPHKQRRSAKSRRLVTSLYGAAQGTRPQTKKSRMVAEKDG
jgi:hypothetical protein